MTLNEQQVLHIAKRLRKRQAKAELRIVMTRYILKKAGSKNSTLKTNIKIV